MKNYIKNLNEFINESLNEGIDPKQIDLQPLDDYLLSLFGTKAFGNVEHVRFHLAAPAKHFTGGVWFQLYIPDGRKVRNITKFIEKEYKEYDVDVVSKKMSGWSMGNDTNWNGVKGMNPNEKTKYVMEVYLK